ncbi:MAG: type II toxin-antitoxin system YafQ family toxin [Gammaproteobacteria bacterium]
MYEIFATNKFKRDIKKCKRQNKSIPKLQTILELLTAGEALPASNRDHNLTGNYASHRECHIEPDWLLIYRINEEEKLIELVRTGSHSELFS